MKLPNPFAKKNEATAYTLDEVPDVDRPSLPRPKLPKLGLPKASALNPAPRMAKINQGTKKALTNVKNLLTPWNKGDSRRSGRATSVTGTQRNYNGSPSSRTASRDNGRDKPRFKLPNPFGKRDADAPEKPTSVPGFLAQERPEF